MMNTMYIALVAAILPCLSLAVDVDFDSISRECYLEPFIGFATAPGGIDTDALPDKLKEFQTRIDTAFPDTSECGAIHDQFDSAITTWTQSVKTNFAVAVVMGKPLPDLTDAELYTFVPEMLKIFNDKSEMCPCMATMSASELQERVFKSVADTNCTLDFKTVGEWINFCGDDNNMLAMEGVCALACSSVDSDKLATTTFGSCSESSTCCECASDELGDDDEGSGNTHSPTPDSTDLTTVTTTSSPTAAVTTPIITTTSIIATPTPTVIDGTTVSVVTSPTPIETASPTQVAITITATATVPITTATATAPATLSARPPIYSQTTTSPTSAPSPQEVTFSELSDECYLSSFLGVNISEMNFGQQFALLGDIGDVVKGSFPNTAVCQDMTEAFQKIQEFVTNILTLVSQSKPLPDFSSVDTFTFLPTILARFSDKDVICPCLASMTLSELQAQLFKDSSTTDCTVDFLTLGEWIDFCGTDPLRNLNAISGVCTAACDGASVDGDDNIAYGCGPSTTCCTCGVASCQSCTVSPTSSQSLLSPTIAPTICITSPSSSPSSPSPPSPPSLPSPPPTQTPSTPPTVPLDNNGGGVTLGSTDDGENVGAMVGGIIGVVLLLIIIVVVVLVLVSRGIIGGGGKSSSRPAVFNNAVYERNIEFKEGQPQNQVYAEVNTDGYLEAPGISAI